MHIYNTYVGTENNDSIRAAELKSKNVEINFD